MNTGQKKCPSGFGLRSEIFFGGSSKNPVKGWGKEVNTKPLSFSEIFVLIAVALKI